MDHVAWSAKVSDTFLDRVKWIVDDLQIGENTWDGMNKFMACCGFESGRTFSASVRNAAGSGAVGLIQFMPPTARKLGTTPDELARMTPEDQLNYVWKYFAPYKGKLKTLADLYMAILWPKAVGKPETYVLWSRSQSPVTFRQNAGLDANRNGDIIKAEAAAKVTAVLVEGLEPRNTRKYEVANSKRGPLASVAQDVEEAADVIVYERGYNIGDGDSHVLELPPTDAVRTVTETPDATTSVVVEPKDTLTRVKKAISGAGGNFAGMATIAGALLLNPDFAAKLGTFTTGLAKGEGGWGALIALIGAGLIAYRHKPSPG